MRQVVFSPSEDLFKYRGLYAFFTRGKVYDIIDFVPNDVFSVCDDKGDVINLYRLHGTKYFLSVSMYREKQINKIIG
jgi:hypothetical protein